MTQLTEQQIAEIARAICCHRDGVPTGCAAKCDGSPFSICQAHTFRGDAIAALTAIGTGKAVEKALVEAREARR